MHPQTRILTYLDLNIGGTACYGGPETLLLFTQRTGRQRIVTLQRVQLQNPLDICVLGTSGALPIILLSPVYVTAFNARKSNRFPTDYIVLPPTPRQNLMIFYSGCRPGSRFIVHVKTVLGRVTLLFLRSVVLTISSNLSSQNLLLLFLISFPINIRRETREPVYDRTKVIDKKELYAINSY